MANHHCKCAKKTTMTTQTTSTTAMVLEDETPGPEDTPTATGEETNDWTSRAGINDAAGPKPSGRSAADVAMHERQSVSLKSVGRIGTWNVRSMMQEKLEIVQREMERTGIEIMGISELRWVGSGHFKSSDYKVLYSGHEAKKRNVVAIICGKKSAQAILGYNTISDRIISTRFRSQPVNISVLQIYAPTTGAEEDEIEEFYDKLRETLDNIPKGDILVVMGDFNAKVGQQSMPPMVGKHGL